MSWSWRTSPAPRPSSAGPSTASLRARAGEGSLNFSLDVSAVWTKLYWSDSKLSPTEEAVKDFNLAAARNKARPQLAVQAGPEAAVLVDVSRLV